MTTEILVRDQISSKCCVSATTSNSICRTIHQTNPHSVTFLQLYKNCLTQLIIILVVCVQFSINFTIFNQLNMGFVTIQLQIRETDLINTINRCSKLSSAGIVTISNVYWDVIKLDGIMCVVWSNVTRCQSCKKCRDALKNNIKCIFMRCRRLHILNFMIMREFS